MHAALTVQPMNCSIMARPLAYMCGFGNDFSSEALPGALPMGQNNPKV
jgi:homogentisate 1,2-dioxygenase